MEETLPPSEALEDIEILTPENAETEEEIDILLGDPEDNGN